MRSCQSFVLDTLRNVQGFLDDNAQLVGPSMAASRRSLEDVVLQLTLHAVDQGGGAVASRAETARQRVLRKTLRTAHMRPIAEVARQKLRDVPEFAALEMPPASFGGSRLVAAASVMADAAALHAPVFNAVGLPDDFIARLRAAADAVTKSLEGRGRSLGRRSGATAGLVDQERRARSMIKLIDALIVPVLGTDPTLLAKWRSVKSIRRARITAVVDPSALVPATPAPTPTPVVVPPATSAGTSHAA